MRQHRGYWNRGTWTRKVSSVEAVETPVSTKTSPVRNAVKDDSCMWTDAARVEDSGSCWDAHIFDASFLDDNKRIFEWDDCGAVDLLTKAEEKLQQGISPLYEDFLLESEQYSASIDWDTRWSCTLPDCAEDVQHRDERKRNLKGNFTRKEQSDTASAVILGLPDSKDDPGRSGTPSLHLPLDCLPVPTGWDEAEESPADSRPDDVLMQPVAVTSVDKAQLEPPSQGCWQPQTNMNEVWVAGTGLPEYPSSYQHIIPSGWGDVQADPPVIPSGWGDLTEEPRSDVQMHLADSVWGECPSKEENGSDSGWGKFHPSVESREVYGNAHTGKQDFYNNSYKYGYWKPKRGVDMNNYESSGRKSLQRHGRPISTMYRVNHDPRPPRMSRLERSKPQWQSTGTLAHGSESVSGESLSGRRSFLDEDRRRYQSYYY